MTAIRRRLTDAELGEVTRLLASGPADVDALRELLAAAPVPDPVADEVAGALADGVPRTAYEIALAIKRRRAVVEEALAADRRFLRASPPPGRSRRARTWTTAPEGSGHPSRPVPTVRGRTFDGLDVLHAFHALIAPDGAGVS
jgi:hypothetical protein